MKVKKYIGKTINGFKILDTYVTDLPSGAKARKVLVECEDCGRLLERTSGVDFEHIKCKCRCKYLEPRKEKFRWIEYNDQKYTQTDFCKMHNISVSTFRSRIKIGLSIEEIIQNDFTSTCVICDKKFTSDRPHKKYCSNTCRNRAGRGKGKYKQPSEFECVVCGVKFRSIRNDAKTCSQDCRRDLARIERNNRYKKLKENDKFDPSVTLKNVFDKYNGICQECGKELTFESNVVDDDYPSIDHIKPISKGGAHEWNNVQLLCRKCNYIKSDKLTT